MDLKSLLKKENVISVAYPDPEFVGFVLELSYVSRTDMLDIRSKCLTHTYNKKTRSMDESMDEDIFTELYIEKMLKGWTGFKYAYLSEIVPIDLAAVNATDELPFTVENAAMLMKSSPVFESVVTELASDIAAFSKA